MKSDRPTRIAFRAEDAPAEVIEALKRELQRPRISLRKLYNSTLTERIPDDIRDLIERLD